MARHGGLEPSTFASASVTDGTTIEYKAGNGAWSTTAPSRTNVGTTTVSVRATNDNYVTATAEYTLTVTPKEVTVTANDKTKVYGEEDPTLDATVEGTIGTDTVDYELSRAEGENVGSYAITPDGDKDQGNYKVSYVNGELTITKSDAMTLTVDSLEKPYDGTALTTTAFY